VFGQRSQLWYQLPPRDTFELLGRVYEIDPRQHRRRIEKLSSVFALGALVTTPVRHLSLGERMRCEIVASLIHSPRMLFLDEPTIGLDVSAKAMIRELLWTESERERVTLLLTSHDTGDMERVCTRAIVINHGRLLWDGPIAALRRSYLKGKRVTLWSDAEHLELSLPGVRILSSGSYRTELEIEIEVTPLGQVVDAAQRQAAIRDMAIEDTPLDDVIRALYAAADTRGVPS
jgi:ABC-2 type transport system ATP-binding protein